MRELEEVGTQPVWVKAVVINDGQKATLCLLDKKGEECGWLEPKNVACVPRFLDDGEDNADVIPPDRVAHTTHSLFPETLYPKGDNK